MSKSPAFQFYPSDFLSDENVSLMSNRELGCYIKLLSHCWLEGSIPSDMGKISRLCGEPKEVMAELWLSLNKCFLPCVQDSTRLLNMRLEKERKKQTDRKKERSESGKRGAKSRWYKNENSDGSAIAKPMAQPMANDSSSSSISTTVINKKTNTSYYQKKGTQLPDDFVLTEEHQDLANELQVDLCSNFELFKDNAISKGLIFKNWNAAFRNWLRNAKRFGHTKQNERKDKRNGSQVIWDTIRENRERRAQQEPSPFPLQARIIE
jgi:uncharacterized protein YdaU (DUF1376 family)